MADRLVNRTIVVQGADLSKRLAEDQQAVLESARAEATSAKGEANRAAAEAAEASDFADRAALSADTAAAAEQAVRDNIGKVDTASALQLQAVSRQALAAIGASQRSDGRQAFLSEPGRVGSFRWRPGDQSAAVAADPLQAFYVAPASQPNGSAGAWQRIYTLGSVVVTWFGAKGDGSDDTTAIQAAINAVVASKGGEVLFPKPPVKYVCDTLSSVDGQTAALHLPRIPLLANAISIALVGISPVSTTTGRNENDICIETTQMGPAVLISGRRANDGYNYINLTVRNLRLRSPINSRIIDLDCRSVRNTFLDTVSFDVPPWAGATHPDYSIDIPELTNGIENVGIYGPVNNIATTFSCRNVYVAGKAYGAVIGELWAGDLTIVGCDAAVGLIAGHHKSVLTLNVYNCSNLLVTINGPVKIDFKVRTEHNSPSGYAGSGPTWVATRRIGYQQGVAPSINDGYDIYDPNSLASGTFDYVMSSVFDASVPAENRIPFSVNGARNLLITTEARLGGILGGGYALNQPFDGFQNVTRRSTYQAVNGFKDFKPYHLVNGRSTAPGSLIGAYLFSNYVDGQGPDFRAVQIAALVGLTPDEAYTVIGARKGKGLISVLGVRPDGVRLELPNAHINTANANNDASGTLTFNNVAKVGRNFVVQYTSQAAPVVTLSKDFFGPSGIDYKINRLGGPGAWTGFEIECNQAVTGRFDYHVIGNGE